MRKLSTLVASAVLVPLAMASSTPVWADATSGSSGASMSTAADACTSAKRHAQESVNYNNGVLDSYGQCACSQRPSDDKLAPNKWSCTVDAYYHKKN